MIRMYIYIYETHVGGEEMGWWFLIYSFNTLQQNPERNTKISYALFCICTLCIYSGWIWSHFLKLQIPVWRPSGNQLLWWHVTPPHFTQIELYTDLERCHVNEQNGRCVRKGWVQGIEVTIAHTHSGGAPEPKLEKDLWLRGIPSTWSSQGFHGFQRLRRTPTSRGSWKNFTNPKKTRKRTCYFFRRKSTDQKFLKSQFPVTCVWCTQFHGSKLVVVFSTLSKIVVKIGSSSPNSRGENEKIFEKQFWCLHLVRWACLKPPNQGNSCVEDPQNSTTPGHSASQHTGHPRLLRTSACHLGGGW